MSSISPFERQPDTVSGQVVGAREHGNTVFLDVMSDPREDQTQFVVPVVEDGTKLPGLGDIVEGRGRLGETETSRSRGLGQVSLFTEQVVILSGGEEARWLPGNPYADQLASQLKYADMLTARNGVRQGIRSILDPLGYVELETSVLQTNASGAAARTFKTEVNFDGSERHMRIAPEIDLKIVMALSGLPKVFEIARNFRNEGQGPIHHPEFTSLETYTAYSDRQQTEELMIEILRQIDTSLGAEVMRKKPDHRRYSDLFSNHAGIDFIDDCADDPEKFEAMLKQYLLRNNILQGDINSQNVAGALDSIFKKMVRPKIKRPTIVDGYLGRQMPLAERMDGNTSPFANAFQLIVLGQELVKAYSEQVNPAALEAALSQQGTEAEGDRTENDERLIRACRMGLPPMWGAGIGVDRYVALAVGAQNISEVIPVPLTGISTVK